MQDTLTIRATWDPDARVWVATSDDVPGLITEADTCEALYKKLLVIIPELLEANGVDVSDSEIPISIQTERTEHLKLHVA